MNEFLDVRFQERIVRLRLGVEPLDALDPATGRSAGLRVHVERVPRPHPLPPDPDDSIGLPALRPSPSGRFSIPFGSRRTDGPDRLTVRIVDVEQRHVPRRLSVPAPDLAAVLAAEQAEAPLARACRPAVFPGATYGVPPGATVVRGRVTWGAGGPPAPWVRVEARSSPGQAAPWRAHGDRHGEFLLLVGPLTQAEAMRAVADVDVDVTVHARRLPPDQDPVDSPAGSRADPLWHLPVEQVGSLDADDAVAAGAVLPVGYTATTTRTVTCRRGGATRPAPFVLT